MWMETNTSYLAGCRYTHIFSVLQDLRLPSHFGICSTAFLVTTIAKSGIHETDAPYIGQALISLTFPGGMCRRGERSLLALLVLRAIKQGSPGDTKDESLDLKYTIKISDTSPPYLLKVFSRVSVNLPIEIKSYMSRYQDALLFDAIFSVFVEILVKVRMGMPRIRGGQSRMIAIESEASVHKLCPIDTRTRHQLACHLPLHRDRGSLRPYFTLKCEIRWSLNTAYMIPQTAITYVECYI